MTDRRLKGVASRLSAAAMLASLVIGVLGVAGPAAGNVLFRMNSGICALFNDTQLNCTGRPMPEVGGTVNGPTLMTTPTASGANFTIPSRLYSTMGSFSAIYGPYPYFQASYTRYNKGGSIMAGALTPNVTLTFVDEDLVYPNLTATPPTGQIIAKIGPKGMAGPNMFFRYSYYTGTYLAPSPNQFIAVIDIKTSAGPASNAPSLAGWLYTYNASNMTNTGAVLGREPNLWAFTGTVTISQPDPAAGSQYIVRTAMDNRTPAGASGTIQVISASLTHNYSVSPLPPPFDGTATATAYKNGLLSGRRTTFEFIPAPEPGQIALIGMGIAGLAGAWRMRRR